MSLFGEIQLGCSRAVSDDEDDEFSTVVEDQTLKRKIYWIKDKESTEKISVDELILADGANSSAFIYTYLISHLKDSSIEVLGVNATLPLYNVFKQNYEDNKMNFESLESSLRSNYIYWIKNLNGKSLIVCQLFDQLKPNEIYDWINQLAERVTFPSAMIFSSQNKSHYLGTENKSTFVRYLSSNNEEVDMKLVRLEAPNLISDLPAGLIHYCTSTKIQFSSFVCYSPCLTADLQSVKEMYNAVALKLKEENPFINDSQSEKTLLSVGKIVSSVSAIYM